VRPSTVTSVDSLPVSPPRLSNLDHLRQLYLVSISLGLPTTAKVPQRLWTFSPSSFLCLARLSLPPPHSPLLTLARSVSAQRPLLRSPSPASPYLPPPPPLVFPVYACPWAIAPSTTDAAIPVLDSDDGDAKIDHQPIRSQAPNVSCVPAPDDGGGTPECDPMHALACPEVNIITRE
jgi:hypothetical protein